MVQREPDFHFRLNTRRQSAHKRNYRLGARIADRYLVKEIHSAQLINDLLGLLDGPQQRETQRLA